jgi:hypothetical protein
LWGIGALTVVISLLVLLLVSAAPGVGVSGGARLLVLTNAAGWVCLLVVAAATGTRLGTRSLGRG